MVPSHLVSGSSVLLGGVFAFIGVAALFPLLFVILVVANRAEPDPRGLRPFSVYLFGMSFVTLMFAYAGATMIVTSFLSFIGPHNFPIANGVARTVVIGGLLVLVAGGTMAYHLRRGLDIARGDDRADGPNGRILHTYVSAVTFIFVVVAIVALILSIYLVFELIGPGVFGSTGGSRTATLRTLLDSVYVMAVAGLVVVGHSRIVPSKLRIVPSTGPSITAE